MPETTRTDHHDQIDGIIRAYRAIPAGTPTFSQSMTAVGELLDVIAGIERYHPPTLPYVSMPRVSTPFGERDNASGEKT